VAVIYVLVVVLAVTSCSCAVRMTVELDRIRAMVQAVDCRDGAPARILIDAHCVDGVCGVSCAPNRWQSERKEQP